MPHHPPQQHDNAIPPYHQESHDIMSVNSELTGDTGLLSSLSTSTFASIPRGATNPPPPPLPPPPKTTTTTIITKKTTSTVITHPAEPNEEEEQEAEEDPSSSEHRAIHRINLSSLRHNYDHVSSCANRQKCSVIVVVKADGYGHGAVETAVHLADYCGADAFAVATLEEGIALRKAFTAANNNTNNVVSGGKSKASNDKIINNVASGGIKSSDVPSTIAAAPKQTTTTTNKTLHPPSSVDIPKPITPPPPPSSTTITPPPKNMRPSKIRILVLGPPTNLPRCFDLYYHYDIEVMVSGCEVAQSLVTWVVEEEERKKKEVERAAMEVKQEVLRNVHYSVGHPGRNEVVRQSYVLSDDDDESDNDSEVSKNKEKKKEKVKNDNQKMSSKSKNDSTTTTTTKSTASQQKTTKPTNTSPNATTPTTTTTQQQTQMQAATLSNVSGMNLAREVRAILMSQQAAVAAKKTNEPIHTPSSTPAVVVPAINNNNDDDDGVGGGGAQQPQTFTAATSTNANKNQNSATRAPPLPTTNTKTPTSANTAAAKDTEGGGTTLFRGIADAAKISRHRQLKAAGRQQQQQQQQGSIKSCCSSTSSSSNTNNTPQQTQANNTQQSLPGKNPPPPPTPTRIKKLKWHALVDSGMGRLGFKPEKGGQLTPPPPPQPPQIQHENHKEEDENGLEDDIVYWRGESSEIMGSSSTTTNGVSLQQRDTVDIIKEMYDMEVHDGAPIEFFGMCTHMADASNSTNSNYTSAQMDRFISLLNRVRDANISVPTVSTDNSAALLTTSLTHFQPNEILSQNHLDTRGYVRTGGAIYGQRPAFQDLRAVSTLLASVRHVAILKEGESVGYDRAYIAPFDVRIATLTIGFADGYPRELGNGVGRVCIRGEVFPVAGNVCMDMLMVELGPVDTTGSVDVGGGGGIGVGVGGEDVQSGGAASSSVAAQVCVGDVAILWGPEGVHDDEDGLIKLADISGTLKTTQSALTCGLNKTRVRRQYVL